MKRLLAMPVIAAVAFVAGGGTALAHEELSPSTISTGRPAFVIFSAANERQVPVTSVTLTAPSGLSLGGVTKEPGGWTVELGDSAVTWSGGPVPPAKFEQWGVELEAPDQPGTFTFRSTLRFADGRTDTHSIVLAVVQGALPVPEAPPAAAPETTTTVAAGPATTVAPVAPEPVDGDGASAPRSGEGRANLALGVGGAAALLGLVALVVAARRPGAAAKVVAEEQTW